MGIKILNSFLRKSVDSGITQVKLSKFKGKVAVIDVSNLLFRYLYSQKDKYLIGFLMVFQRLVENSIYPIFCFDGLPPREKAKTLTKRQNAIKKRHKKISDVSLAIGLLDDIIDKKYSGCLSRSPEFNPIPNNEYKIQNEEHFYRLLLEGKKPHFNNISLAEIEKLRLRFQTELARNNQKCTKITKKIIDDLKELFKLLNIKYLHSRDKIEADLLCSSMVRKGFADFAISDDLDLLPLGCPTILRNFNYDTENVTEYYLDNIIEELHLDNLDNLIDLCLVCGTDYTNKISQIKNANDLSYIIDNLKKSKTINDFITEYANDSSSDEDSIDPDEYTLGKSFFKRDYELSYMVADHNFQLNTLPNEMLSKNDNMENNINENQPGGMRLTNNFGSENYQKVINYVQCHSPSHNPILLQEIMKNLENIYTDEYRNQFQYKIDHIGICDQLVQKEHNIKN